MSIAAIFVGLLLFGLTAYAAALPWRRQAQRAVDQAGAAGPLVQDRLPRLEDQRDASYAALADLEFDRSIGKVNEDDYQRMRGQMMAQTVAVLQEIDAQTVDVESQVEALVRVRRAQTTKSVPAKNGNGAMRCPSCSAAVRTGDRFCGRCGAELGHTCPTCSAEIKADDSFCVHCGSTVARRAATA